MTRALKTYKSFFSPVIHALFGTSLGGCRFYPTCSEYTAQAMKERGIINGVWLSLRRVSRCNPFFKGGIDELPKQK